jgi:hypothetical protein
VLAQFLVAGLEVDVNTCLVRYPTISVSIELIKKMPGWNQPKRFGVVA